MTFQVQVRHLFQSHTDAQFVVLLLMTARDVKEEVHPDFI